MVDLQYCISFRCEFQFYIYIYDLQCCVSFSCEFQFFVYICIYTHTLLRFFSVMGCYKILNTVSCAIQ